MDRPAAEGGEIRLDKMMQRWVIMAPRRGRRPRDHGGRDDSRPEPAEHDPSCPFCPGNEERLGPVLLETGSGDGWATRVVANKYPALSAQGSLKRRRDGIYLKMGGYGRHEVVIETPRHDRHPAVMTREEIEAVVETYHRRYRDLIAMDGNILVLIFRNHGWRAGTSLVHPHSQIVATGMVPQGVRMRETGCRRYYHKWGRCVLCDILDFERRKKERLVLEDEAFAAFVPYAAEVPFETWIVPREHSADFGSLRDHQKGLLSAALQQVLRRLRDKLDDPHYNYIVSSATRHRADEPHLHWHIRIKPRLTTQAGFEMGSGISVNPSLPEEDAALLRGGERRGVVE